jgi:hypothetical protein
VFESEVRNEVPSMLFSRKIKKLTYGSENQIPVLRCSICTGEQVAGFKDVHTGKFTEVTVIRSRQDLDTFMKTYDISTITKEY